MTTKTLKTGRKVLLKSMSLDDIDHCKDMLEINFKDGAPAGVSGLNKPTDSQLASYETAGNTVETNAGIDATRRSQYGTWREQMEMIYKDQKNGTSTFKDHCDKVRSDNPKG